MTLKHVCEIIQGDKQEGAAEDVGAGWGRWTAPEPPSPEPSAVWAPSEGLPGCPPPLQAMIPDSSREVRFPGFSAPPHPSSPARESELRRAGEGV